MPRMVHSTRLTNRLLLSLLPVWAAACGTPLSQATASGTAIRSGEVTSVSVSDVSGADTVRGLLEGPSGAGPFPAVLVVHGALGLDEQVRVWMRRLASEGYVAFAVDLYGGRVPHTLDEGVAIFRTRTSAQRQHAIDAAIRFLRSRTIVRADRIGALGWCAGGAMVFRLVARDTGLRAAVIHYGAVTAAPAVLQRVHAAVLGIFGGADGSIPVDTIRAFETEMRQQGKDATVVIYPGVGHAFESLAPSGPNSNGYHPVEAADALRRTVEFLGRHLK